MIKLFVQHNDNKFINNILLSQYSNIQILSAAVGDNIYKLFYKTEFDVCIFSASSINTAIYQFIKEFEDTNMRVFLHHTNINNGLLDLRTKNLTHLVDTTVTHQNHKQIITLPPLINKDIFTKRGNAKLDFISCFLDNVQNIPHPLLQKLYPNSRLPIKLFNNTNIRHAQNLGTITERDKAYILNKSTYYLSIDHHYAAEASAAGCVVLDPTELDDMRENKYKHIKTPQTYSRYIEKLLCE